VCGATTVESLAHDHAHLADGPRVEAAMLPPLAQQLRGGQRVFDATGGLHAAGLFTEGGELVTLREDIGRHNAVDKVIGHMLRARRLPLDRQILMVSGRASFEIMQKAWVARIPIVAAVSAPSSMAVQMALTAGMTLVGFLRGSSFNVYAGAQRVTPAVPELV
jgi:FdhD protein